MKKLLFISILFSLLFSSCEKSSDPGYELPAWLKEKIEDHDEVIASQADSYLRICAWISHTWEKNQYFEFSNPISSSFPSVYNYKGEIITDSKVLTPYYEERCCKTFIWKGPDCFFD